MSRIQIILKIVFAVAILVWLTHSRFLSFAEIKSVFHPLYFSLCLLAIGGSFFLNSERWRLLLASQKIQLSRFTALKLFLIGLFFNFVIPGGVGGDVVKAYYIKKDSGQEAPTSPFSVIADRFIGVFSLVFMALFVVILEPHRFLSNPKLFSLGAFIAVIFLGLVATILLSFSQKFRNKLTHIFPKKFVRLRSLFEMTMESMEYYTQSPKTILTCILLSFISQTLAIFSLVVVGQATGEIGISYGVYFFAAPLGFITSAIPIAPAGIGIGQAAFLFLFNLYLGYETSLGATVITIFQFFSLLISLSGLYFYLVRKKVS